LVTSGSSTDSGWTEDAKFEQFQSMQHHPSRNGAFNRKGALCLHSVVDFIIEMHDIQCNGPLSSNVNEAYQMHRSFVLPDVKQPAFSILDEDVLRFSTS
jgi:hypothetical protein